MPGTLGKQDAAMKFIIGVLGARGTAALLALVLACAQARAQVPPLDPIPQSLREPARSLLEGERQPLAARLARLQEQGRAFNSRCASVRANSPEAAQCRSSFAELSNARETYSADVREFDARLARAVRLDAASEGDRRAVEDEIARTTPSIGAAITLGDDAAMVDERGVRHTGLVPVQLVRKGYEFETGTRGTVKIEVANSWSMLLAARAKLRFEQLVRDAALEVGELEVALSKGKVKVVERTRRFMNRRFRVGTSLCTIAVLGTEFDVEVTSDGLTIVSMTSGEADVTPRAGGPAVHLMAGQAVRVDRAGQITPEPDTALVNK